MTSLEKEKDKHTELFLQRTQPKDHMTTHTQRPEKGSGKKNRKTMEEIQMDLDFEDNKNPQPDW